MRTIFNFLFVLYFISLVGCSSNSTDRSQKTDDTTNTTSSNINSQQPEILADFLGIYAGDQEAYTMKNQFGDDMIISGKRVKVPECNYKLVLKEKNQLSIQQTSKEDESRYYYDGTYSIVKEDNDYYDLECKVSDGKSSKLTYKMTINKKEFSIHCVGHNEPDFDLFKTDVKRKDSKEVDFEGILGTEFMENGEWSIDIEITKGTLKGKTIKAYITTSGNGMSDENSIEHTGNVDLNGADEHNGKKVKGVLVASKGEFSNLSESDERIFSKVWRIKELNFR